MILFPKYASCIANNSDTSTVPATIYSSSSPPSSGLRSISLASFVCVSLLACYFFFNIDDRMMALSMAETMVNTVVLFLEASKIFATEDAIPFEVILLDSLSPLSILIACRRRDSNSVSMQMKWLPCCNVMRYTSGLSSEVSSKSRISLKPYDELSSTLVDCYVSTPDITLLQIKLK